MMKVYIFYSKSFQFSFRKGLKSDADVAIQYGKLLHLSVWCETLLGIDSTPHHLIGRERKAARGCVKDKD
jgi:hypothetical protein